MTHTFLVVQRTHALVPPLTFTHDLALEMPDAFHVPTIEFPLRNGEKGVFHLVYTLKFIFQSNLNYAIIKKYINHEPLMKDLCNMYITAAFAQSACNKDPFFLCCCIVLDFCNFPR